MCVDVLQNVIGMATSIQQDLDEAQQRLNDGLSDVQELNEKITRQENVIHQHEDTISDMQVYEISAQQLRVKIEEKEREVERAYEAVETEMEETDQELQVRSIACNARCLKQLLMIVCPGDH